WQPDGRKLAAVEQEAHLFDEVAQRKALQAELDGVRVLRSGLRNLVNDWQKVSREQATLKKEVNGALLNPPALAEFLEHLARQDAHLLAAKTLLLRTHARMEHGLDSEGEAALLRVWFLEAGISFEETQTLLRQHFEMRDREH